MTGNAMADQPANSRGPAGAGQASQASGMCLVVAVVHDEDTEPSIAALTRAGIRVTRIPTVGAFLSKGNSTLLMGVEVAQVPRVERLLRDTCKQRTEYAIRTVLADYTGMIPVDPVEVQVGGATIFVLDVERFERL